MSSVSTRIITAGDVGRIVAAVGLDALMDDMIARLVRACEEHDPARCRSVSGTAFTSTSPSTV